MAIKGSIRQKNNIKTTVHGKKEIVAQTVALNAHSSWYYEPFNDCGFDLDVVLECKQKERALLKYRKDFLT